MFCRHAMSFRVSACTIVFFAMVSVVYAQHIQSARHFTTSAYRKAYGLDPHVPITDYIHEVWSKDQGLPQVSAEAFLQTKDGYFWIATQEGLARYDGARFRVFNTINSALPSSYITALLQDKQGRLWCGTSAAGVFCMENGTIDRLTTQNGLSDDVITQGHSSLVQDSAGTIWVATQGGGLNALRNGKVTSVLRPENGLLSNRVNVLCVDAHGTLWIGTDNGLQSLDNNGKFRTKYTTREGLIHNNVRAITLDSSNGTLWIGTSGGLQQMKERQIKEKPSEAGWDATWTNYTIASGLSGNAVTALFLDTQKTLWVGTENNGISRFALGAWSHYGKQEGLTDNAVTTFLEDVEGNFYVGTDGGGVNRFRPASVSLPRRDVSDVWSITEDRTGAMWCATNADGVFRIAPDDGTKTHFTTRNGLPSNNARIVMQDADGSMLLGFAGTAGFCRILNGRVTERHRSEYEIYCFLRDHKGILWVGTNKGLASFAQGKFTFYGKKEGLFDSDIAALYESTDGALWVGSLGGLACLKNGKVIASFTTDNIGRALNVMWISEDRSGTLWIGTLEGGMNRLKNGSLKHCSTKQGLFDNVVHSILEDDNGYLWVSCNKGIYRVKKQEVEEVCDGTRKSLTCEGYGKIDGMLVEECNGGYQSAAWKSRDGRLLFATLGGAAVVNPNTLPLNSHAPSVLVEQMLADGRRVSGTDLMAGDSSADIVHSPYNARLQLAAGTGKIEWHYTATSFTIPKRVKFKYFLEGYDIDWTDAGTRRTAYYTNLPRGRSYRFRVIACNNDGIWNEVGASVEFDIASFWWETWWFRSLAVILVVGGLYQSVRWRIQRLHARTQELERIVADRTKALRTANEEISQQVEILHDQAVEIQLINTELHETNLGLDTALHDLKATQSQLVQSERMSAVGMLTAGVMHEINNPNAIAYSAITQTRAKLDEMTTYFLSMLDDESKDSDEVRKFQELSRDAISRLELAADGASRVKAIVANLQGFTKHQENDVLAGDWAKEIRGTVSLFQLQYQHIAISTNIPATMSIHANFGELNQVVLNILVNAAQAGASELRIDAAYTATQATVSIADNGGGIPPEVQANIFEPFFSTKGVGNSGLGLSISKQILERHGGVIWCESMVGSGATFFIELPIVSM